MIKKTILLIAGIILVTGCVTTKKYEASLNNASTIQAEKEDLGDRLQDIMKRLKKETEVRESLERDIVKLKVDRDDLVRHKESLLQIKQAEKEDLGDRLQDIMKRLKKEKEDRESLERDMVKLKVTRDDLVRHKESLLQINHDLNETVAKLSQEKIETIKDRDRTITELIIEKEKAIAQLKGTYDNLVSELNEEIERGEIEVTQLKDKLTLSMVEKILFDSGSAAIKQNGKEVLARVGDILRSIHDKQIRIEGHTDNVQIGPVLAEKFPTNWELSTARSTTVVRYLQQQGVDPTFLSAAGYSEYSPVDANETEEGRARNRRIEIILIPLETDRIATAASVQ